MCWTSWRDRGRTDLLWLNRNHYISGTFYRKVRDFPPPLGRGYGVQVSGREFEADTLEDG
jgi:hypothetical protein